jgi:hypothetical protein
MSAGLPVGAVKRQISLAIALRIAPTAPQCTNLVRWLALQASEGQGLCRSNTEVRCRVKVTGEALIKVAPWESLIAAPRL